VILAVAGGKGGVGKTTLAYNVAAALDAVVVDADLGMADLPGGRGPDLHDVLAGEADSIGRCAPVRSISSPAVGPSPARGRPISGGSNPRWRRSSGSAVPSSSTVRRGGARTPGAARGR